MKRLLFILLLSLIPLTIFAQEITVSGIVVDSHNEPIPGATIEIVGRSETSTTDIDGRFVIHLPATAKKVKVSYPGYKPIEVKISDNMLIKMGSGWGASASGFRGFVNMQGGFGFGGKVNAEAGDLFIKDLRTLALFGLNTSYGYQLNRNLFLGLGFGILFNQTSCKTFSPYTTWEGTDGYSIDSENVIYAATIPIFANARWDFGLDKKSAPYVDLKVGYQFSLPFESCGYEHLGGTHSNTGPLYQDLSIQGHRASGLFLQPSFGIRTSIGGKKAVNIGVAYSIVVPRKLTAEYSYQSPNQEYYEWETERKDIGTVRGGAVLLNIGFDF